MMPDKEPTNFEILQAINEFANTNEDRWQKNEDRLTRIEATMVTKDYLDGKLADFKGDIIAVIRKKTVNWQS